MAMLHVVMHLTEQQAYQKFSCRQQVALGIIQQSQSITHARRISVMSITRVLTQNTTEAAAGLQPIAARLHASSL